MARSKSAPRQVTAESPVEKALTATSPSSSTNAHVLSCAAILAFPALTLYVTPVLAQDPVKILAYSVPVVAMTQTASVLATSTVGNLPTKGKKKQQSRSTLSTAVLALILTLLLSPFVHVIFILFGAPVIFSAYSTYLLSLHTSLLALFPLLCTVPLDSASWIRIVAGEAPLTPAYTAAIGTCIGAWLGAVPIPLDWDREWQTWPVTVIVGEYVGTAVGRLVGVYLLDAKKVKTK